MIWVILILCHILHAGAAPHPDPLSKEINEENYILNLRYDHCKRPMAFSWKKLKCECPPPLTRSGQTCVCNNCVSEDIQQWHSEGSTSHLPAYINEIFEEIDEDLAESEKNQTNDAEDLSSAEETNLDETKVDQAPPNDTEEEDAMLPDTDKLDEDTDDDLPPIDSLRKKRSIEEPLEMSPPYQTFLHSPYTPMIFYLDGQMYVLRPPRMRAPLVPALQQWARRSNAYNHPPRGGFAGWGENRRSLQQRQQRRTRQPLSEDLEEGRKVLVPKTKTLDVSKMKVLKLKTKPQNQAQSFSDSVVAGSMEGKTSSGLDRAEGMVSSFRGTGAMALGSGGGSAGGAAFTGMGTSNLVVASKGAHAKGEAFIGESASEGTSTTSLLLGTGDAIAANSLGGKGSSSAAGFSTKHTAGAATAAFGPASASVSATPGKGDTSSSASFAEGLNTAAGVQGENNSTIVESTAVGNPDQDITQLSPNKTSLFRSQTPIRIEPTELDFQAVFGETPENGTVNNKD